MVKRPFPRSSSIFLLLLFCLWIPWRPPALAAAATTDLGEVESLKSIANKWKLTQWSFSVDPCAWNGSVAPSIECKCTNSTCHVTTLNVYNLNLVGEIPLEVVNLTQLEFLTAGLNLLNGPIPAQLGTLTQLQNIDLGINQLSGSVPPELGNLTNLQSLGFGSNLLSGSFPKDLGRLTSLTGLYLDGSGLSGDLPVEFGNLISLENVWMFGNYFSGQIPDIFGNMSKLTELRMYGNNFTGPIPTSLVSLPSIQILSVGDLSNGGLIPSSFKALKNVTYLSLRYSSLSGSIPEDLGSLSNLQFLDLSFNNLTGKIPSSFGALTSLTILFLRNNSLQGDISVLKELTYYSFEFLDVSNNQLSGQFPTWFTESSLEVNLLWNFFNESNAIDRVPYATFNCLDSVSPCDRTSPGQNALFAINCGGPEVLVASTQTTYSADIENLRSSSVYQSDKVWGVSNTGYDSEDAPFSTMLTTTSIIQGASDQNLYNTARGTASSLKYIGAGMINGLYNVELHFAEIVILADDTWKSVGRRIFDVHIQGLRVLKDFNIRAAANGSYKALVKSFTANVTDNVLEIHLLWSGKGTCCVPTRWTYGPLISAIRVYAASSSTPNIAAIVVPVLAGVLACFLLIFFLWRRRHRKVPFGARRMQGPDYLTSSGFATMEAKPHMFTYNDLKIATEDFHVNNKLGEGGFGTVYKGHLSDGTVVAVKQLINEAEKGRNEFINEVATVSSVQHRNLVKLIGCCVEEGRKILVFEFLENCSISQTLFGKRMFLDWPTRFNICIGIARGLTYLHEESRTRIVHRDIKASNILLDENLNPKIADFGLAKLYKEDKTHVSTRVAGTIGYLAPEYALRGKLTEKADVYSFGILLLEIVCGRSNTDTSLPNEKVYLLEWTWQLYEENRILELADESLEGNFPEEEVERVLHVALLCMQSVAAARPKMSEALSMLGGNTQISLNLTRPGFLSDLRQISSEPPRMHSVRTTSSTTTTSYSIGDQTISVVEPR